MIWIEASQIMLSLLATLYSRSNSRRRKLNSHAKLRSTTHRLGSRSNPPAPAPLRTTLCSTKPIHLPGPHLRRAAVVVVGEHLRQLRPKSQPAPRAVQHAPQPDEQLRHGGGLAVLHLRAGHHQCHRQAERVDGDVPFAAFYAFARVVADRAPRAPFFVVFTLWASTIASLGRASARPLRTRAAGCNVS